MKDRIALLDMDGTIADYDSAMNDALATLRSPGEPVFERGLFPDWIEARRTLIAMQPGFWRNLRPLPLGFSIVDVLMSLDFRITVLTKGPNRKPGAWSEKVEWCREYLPGVPVTITEDKSHTYGKLLVDDWPPYVMGWLGNRPRGIVIMPAQSWNEGADAQSPNIFRYDGSNPLVLRRVLEAVAARRSGETLDLQAIIATV